MSSIQKKPVQPKTSKKKEALSSARRAQYQAEAMRTDLSQACASASRVRANERRAKESQSGKRGRKKRRCQRVHAV
eukprot:4510908-Pleurochrysis_carterae.AAC.3